MNGFYCSRGGCFYKAGFGSGAIGSLDGWCVAWMNERMHEWQPVGLLASLSSHHLAQWFSTGFASELWSYIWMFTRKNSSMHAIIKNTCSFIDKHAILTEMSNSVS